MSVWRRRGADIDIEAVRRRRGVAAVGVAVPAGGAPGSRRSSPIARCEAGCGCCWSQTRWRRSYGSSTTTWPRCSTSCRSSSWAPGPRRRRARRPRPRVAPVPAVLAGTGGGAGAEGERAVADTRNRAPAPPSDFRCPISLDLMRDPVVVANGQTYDRESSGR
ncbi:hypothetical protein DAI22_03g093800 [Oryza sativa Japonica Group]|nr:hypothetical protein DAI22_03g093800 [Oryza sativa Japonica Group]